MVERRVRFSFPSDLDVAWTPRQPEVAIAANGVSMLMPHVEPYVVRSVRAVLERLAPTDAERARDFIRQELRHQSEHRRFNDLVIAAHPGLRRVDDWARRTYLWLGRRRSDRFNLAFAAGSETVAFALARWTEDHHRMIFDGADDVVATLFLWHLAEEVEHKAVVHDAYRAVDGSPVRYLAASAVSVLLLTWFTLLSTIVMLHGTGRLWSPLAWFRVVRHALSLAFEVLPDLAASAMPGHHPSDFVDPVLMCTWLRNFDPGTATMPLWSAQPSSSEMAYSGQLSAASRAERSSSAGTSPATRRTA